MLNVRRVSRQLDDANSPHQTSGIPVTMPGFAQTSYGSTHALTEIELVHLRSMRAEPNVVHFKPNQ